MPAGLPGNIPASARGSYILVVNLRRGQRLVVGSLGPIDFVPGCYAYVGSAMGGLVARLSYHLKRHKKPHWHIDYLLERAPVRSIMVYESDVKTECAIARVLESQLASVPGFGASDCRCQGHLFYASDERLMRSKLAAAGLTGGGQAG